MVLQRDRELEPAHDDLVEGDADVRHTGIHVDRVVHHLGQRGGLRGDRNRIIHLCKSKLGKVSKAHRNVKNFLFISISVYYIVQR